MEKKPFSTLKKTVYIIERFDYGYVIASADKAAKEFQREEDNRKFLDNLSGKSKKNRFKKK